MGILSNIMGAIFGKKAAAPTQTQAAPQGTGPLSTPASSPASSAQAEARATPSAASVDVAEIPDKAVAAKKQHVAGQKR